MLNSVLFGSYCVSMAAVAMFQIKQKQIDDFEREIKEYREFEYEHETLATDNRKKAIVLAKYEND